MISKPSAEPVWIATRTYQRRRSDADEWKPLFVGIAAPKKLEPSERVIDGKITEYGCLIQVGLPMTRRFVPGEDALKALFHGILAIEIGLITISNLHSVAHLDGTPFDANREGFLSGTLAATYTSLISSKIWTWDKEWGWAYAHCERLIHEDSRHCSKAEKNSTLYECAKSHVSQKCGGDRVE